MVVDDDEVREVNRAVAVVLQIMPSSRPEGRRSRVGSGSVVTGSIGSCVSRHVAFGLTLAGLFFASACGGSSTGGRTGAGPATLAQSEQTTESEQAEESEPTQQSVPAPEPTSDAASSEEDAASSWDFSRGPGIVTLRPVILCQPDGVDAETSSIPRPVGAEFLPYPTGAQACAVGPPAGTGEIFARDSAIATVDQQGGWVINVDLRTDGEAIWNSLAQMCFSGAETCPSRQLAIVLDDVIVSAPVVQTPDFPGSVQISGDFSEGEVRSLARVLNRGAYPEPEDS